MTKWQQLQELDRRAAVDAIGAGDLFFSGHDAIVHEHPVLDRMGRPFDDDLSGEDGHHGDPGK